MTMELLSEYSAYAVPMDQIWVDPDFNCRDRFSPESVKTLADDIQEAGLTYPLLVQPWEKHPPYSFRLIAGFRRHAACRLLRLLKVPAMITERDLTEFEAHRLNFMENLERKDLNILEEAKGIRKLFPAGEAVGTIARELGKTRNWIHRRLRLLELPYDVQLMFASGRLAQNDLDVILPLRGIPEVARSFARQLLDARLESPQKVRKLRSKLRFGRHVADSRRTKAEIGKMIGRMFEMGIEGLPPRVAAWCAGGVTDEELLKDLTRYELPKRKKKAAKKDETVAD